MSSATRRVELGKVLSCRRVDVYFFVQKLLAVIKNKDKTLDSKYFCDEVETVNGFCYLGDRLNACEGSKAVVTARVRIDWVRFRECGEL